MKKNKLKDIINLLASVNFAIVLFITWLIFIIIGTINEKVFYEWYFILFLCFLSINLCFASFVKVFPRAKKAFIKPNFLKFIPHKLKDKNFIYKTNNKKYWIHILNLAHKNKWKISLNQTNTAFILQKGYFHRLGASITHIGILIILFSSLLNFIFGFTGNFRGHIGDIFTINKIPYLTIQIKNINRINYPNGSPKQWLTEIMLYWQKQALFKVNQNISVNKPFNLPLFIHHLQFYQADWENILQIKLNNQIINLPLEQLKNTNSYTALIQAGNLGLSFLWNNKTLKILSITGTNIKNLKLLAELKRGEIYTMNDKMKLQFIEIKQKTGIQYKYAPSDNLTFLGMIILLIGVFIAFGSKRTIWGIMSNNTVFIIGHTDRNKSLFKEEFNSLLPIKR